MNCLIVEDDALMRSFLVDCLEDMGHATANCATVAEALHALKSGKFDLLLVDFTLPDGTSVPVIDYFGATCPNSRVILLTGSGVFPNGETAIFAPAVDWTLRKPVDLHDLRAIVEYAERDAGHEEVRYGRTG